MTEEEKHSVTSQKVRELEERRENRLEAVHNNNIAACHDARVTLKNIKIEVSVHSHPTYRHRLNSAAARQPP